MLLTAGKRESPGEEECLKPNHVVSIEMMVAWLCGSVMVSIRSDTVKITFCQKYLFGDFIIHLNS